MIWKKAVTGEVWGGKDFQDVTYWQFLELKNCVEIDTSHLNLPWLPLESFAYFVSNRISKVWLKKGKYVFEINHIYKHNWYRHVFYPISGNFQLHFYAFFLYICVCVQCKLYRKPNLSPVNSWYQHNWPDIRDDKYSRERVVLSVQMC